MTLMTATMILLADIFMMGDSTMCDYKAGSYPQEGWGQRLRTFAKDGVKIHNRAVGGISSKTFIDSGADSPSSFPNAFQRGRLFLWFHCT